MEKSLKSQKKFYERKRRREIARETGKKMKRFLKRAIKWTSFVVAFVLAFTTLCQMVGTVAVKTLLIFVLSVLWMLLFLKANEGSVKRNDLHK